MREESRGTDPDHDPAQSKSVTFDLVPEYSPGDPGYETDDSESTISEGENSRHRHEHHYDRVYSSYTPRPSTSRHSAAADSGGYGHGTSSRSHHSQDHHNHRDHHDRDQEPVSDSDSTIDLPDRFDSKGRLLPQHEEDPLGDHFEDLIRGISHVLF